MQITVAVGGDQHVAVCDDLRLRTDRCQSRCVERQHDGRTGQSDLAGRSDACRHIEHRLAGRGIHRHVAHGVDDRMRTDRRAHTFVDQFDIGRGADADLAGSGDRTSDIDFGDTMVGTQLHRLVD